MSIKIPKTLLFLLPILFCLALYLPSINGTPIWDDLIYWFSDPVIMGPYSYLDIWKNFAWPMSVSIQKVLSLFWRHNYLNYHLLNLAIHFFNSYLVYLIARRLHLKHSFILFFLFLIHPASVVTVAWMVQLKTLLCFTFTFATFLLFIKSIYKPAWIYPAWFLFALAVLTKSAALFFPVVLLFWFHRKLHGKRILVLVPFFLISFWGGFRLLRSEVAVTGIKQASELVAKVDQVAQTAPPVVSAPVVNQPKVTAQVTTAPLDKVEVKPTVPTKPSTFKLILKTMNYYFWQALVPSDLAPVKGLNPNPPGFSEYLHLLFIILLVVIHILGQKIIPLLSAHLMLIPFLGIIPAPYMNITWVSDQHLYLALPFFLIYWMMVYETFDCQAKFLIPVLLLIFFSFKTYQASKFYQNKISFYEGSLQQHPLNVPITYNLAFSYLEASEFDKSYNLLNNFVSLAQEYPVLKQDRYYPQTVNLFLNLERGK